MPTGTQDATDSGQSTANETDSRDAKDVEAAFDDDTDFSDGEEVESRFEAKDDDEAATDSDSSSDDSDSEDDDESDDDSTDDADDETSSEDTLNDQEELDEDATDASAIDAEADRKKHDDEMAKARIAEREARDEADKMRRDKEEGDLQRYLDDAGDDEAEKARREINIKEYKLQQREIEINERDSQASVDRAVSSIDLFRTGSQTAQDELNEALDDFEAKYYVYNDRKQLIEIKNDPKTGKKPDLVAYLQVKADRIRKLQGEGALKQETSKKKEKSRSITPPVRAPRKEKVDADMASFDAEAAR